MRLRLLPILMFALVGGTTIKLGSVWNAFELSVGTESMAQTQPTPAAQPAQAPATQAPAAQPPAAAAQPAAAGTPEATAPATEQASAPIDLLQGQPEGGGATSDVAGDTTAEPIVPDPFDYTDEEIDVLQQLSKRRQELDLRARQLDDREALIQAAEQRMDQKMAELKALQANLQDLMKQHSDAEEAELQSLVKLYQNMKPKAAAQVFEQMDMDVLLDIVERMNERKAAPILALVSPARAKEITFELTQRRQLVAGQ